MYDKEEKEKRMAERNNGIGKQEKEKITSERKINRRSVKR